MKKLSIILLCALVALAACTKSKEVHPEIGDGNDEILTIGAKDVHVKYTRTDFSELQEVIFHYSLAEAQQFAVVEMIKRETFFELTLNDLLSDTLYCYYYELFPNNGDAFNTSQKTFYTQLYETPEPPVIELPIVITTEITEITTNSAICGGEVTQDGGTDVTERGVCWSMNENPTLDDNHIAEGVGTGAFTIAINGLEANTTYHVRAYATNEVGTAYGLDKEFSTPSSGGISDAPEGAINGLFTINANGDKVYFSQGNIQYQASTNTWRFAENQWDYVGSEVVMPDCYPGGTVWGSSNHLISPSYDGWIDLFGWGTSGYNHGAVCYQPWSTSRNSSDYYAYGNAVYNLFDMTGQADWGFNPIINGNNTENFWRSLTMDEWAYVFSTRYTSSGMHYAKANVNGANGVILLPDNWNVDTFALSNTDIPSASFSSNVIAREEWTNMESAGAVFLPAAGFRDGSEVGYVNVYGVYCTASKGNDIHAKCITFEEDSFYWQWANYNGRNVGEAVRLAHDAR